MHLPPIPLPTVSCCLLRGRRGAIVLVPGAQQNCVSTPWLRHNQLRHTQRPRSYRETVYLTLQHPLLEGHQLPRQVFRPVSQLFPAEGPHYTVCVSYHQLITPISICRHRNTMDLEPNLNWSAWAYSYLSTAHTPALSIECSFTSRLLRHSPHPRVAMVAAYPCLALCSCSFSLNCSAGPNTSAPSFYIYATAP